MERIEIIMSAVRAQFKFLNNSWSFVKIRVIRVP